MATPILDLSYRNYDGPMDSSNHRWWAIAKMTIRLAIKKKGFWWWSALSGYWYLILIAVFYFLDTFATNLPPLGGDDTRNPFLVQIVWRDQFVHAFSISQLLLFIVALLVGAGSIANDNRANALLVYLSKPCTKLDYIIGKWVGIALPIFLVSFVPTLIFYIYGALTFADYGFLDDKLLLPKLALMCSVAGVVHASLCLGISSLFNQGRMAGATYAGLYFFGLFFTKAMEVAHAVGVTQGNSVPQYVKNLYFASVDGLQIAMAKIILNTTGSPLLPGPPGGGRRGPNAPQFNPQDLLIGPPPAAAMVAILVGVCAAFVLLAWRRVRAVEVVG